MTRPPVPRDRDLNDELARLREENERLQRFIDTDTPGQCRDCPGGTNWEAENASLRETLDCVKDRETKAWEDMRAENARLREDAAKWKTAWELQDHSACYAEHARLREAWEYEWKKSERAATVRARYIELLEAVKKHYPTIAGRVVSLEAGGEEAAHARWLEVARDFYQLIEEADRD